MFVFMRGVDHFINRMSSNNQAALRHPVGRVGPSKEFSAVRTTASAAESGRRAGSPHRGGENSL
ncbi:MAG: hypothetical protein KDK53_02495 [Maritimibacter sp.]|nr:hypothetical protein [Maritimibacter sp.]